MLLDPAPGEGEAAAPSAPPQPLPLYRRRWHHVAVTSEGNTYLDGALNTALAASGEVTGAACGGVPNSAFVANMCSPRRPSPPPPSPRCTPQNGLPTCRDVRPFFACALCLRSEQRSGCGRQSAGPKAGGPPPLALPPVPHHHHHPTLLLHHHPLLSRSRPAAPRTRRRPTCSSTASPSTTSPGPPSVLSSRRQERHRPPLLPPATPPRPILGSSPISAHLAAGGRGLPLAPPARQGGARG